MHKTMFKWRAGACFVGLVAVHAGCASSNGPEKELTLSSLPRLQSERFETALYEDLTNLVEYAEHEIAATADKIQASTEDRNVQRVALLWKLNFTERSNRSLAKRQPLPLLTDFWAFTIRQTNYLTNGEGKELFGDQQLLAVETAVSLQSKAETLARNYLPGDTLPDAVRRLESFARDNPIHGVFEFQLAEAFSSGQEVQGLLSKIIGVPWQLTKSGREALDPTSNLARSVERFTELMEDYPSMVRWQTQLLWYDIQNSPSMRTTVSSIENLSESSVRLAAVAETLPQQVREEIRLALDDIEARQPEIRKTLDHAKEAVKATHDALKRAETVSGTIERSVDAVTRAGEVWQTTAESVTGAIKQIQQFGKPRTLDETQSRAAVPEGGGGGVTTTRKFDIKDYTETADALTVTTEELRALLSEVRMFLDSDSLDQDLTRFKTLTTTAFAQTGVEIRGLVDHFAWRIAQLLALLLILALFYRYLASRFVAKAMP